MLLKDRVAVIYGAGGGIGGAVARATSPPTTGCGDARSLTGTNPVEEGGVPGHQRSPGVLY